MQGQDAVRVPFSPCPDYQRAVTALVFRRDPSITLADLRAMQADLEAQQEAEGWFEHEPETKQ